MSRTTRCLYSVPQIILGTILQTPVFKRDVRAKNTDINPLFVFSQQESELHL